MTELQQMEARMREIWAKALNSPPSGMLSKQQASQLEVPIGTTTISANQIVKGILNALRPVLEDLDRRIGEAGR
jgi:hypothetical protein